MYNWLKEPSPQKKKKKKKKATFAICFIEILKGNKLYQLVQLIGYNHDISTNILP